MNRPQTETDRVFLRQPFALYYRRARRVRWMSEARADYTILFLLDGALKFQVAGGEALMREGSALLLDPGLAATASGQESEHLSLTLSPAYMLDCALRTRLVGEHTRITFRSAHVEQDERLARLAHDLASELQQEDAGQELVIAALVEQTVVHLLRHHTNVRRADELELSRVGLVDRRIRRAVELMHAHLDRDLPLGEIAAAAHLSTFHFARLFKKLTGASPHAYLATLRATRAQTLLAETDLSVTEISARVGYASSSHFTKAFRQATSFTPRAFRAALVQSNR